MIRFIKNYSDKLVTNKVIEAEDQELYAFGLQQTLLILVNVLTTVVLGIIFGMILESILFLVSYIPLRSFAGGYHSKTPLRCYLFSLFLTMAVLAILKYILWTNIMIIGVAVIASVVIFILAPVEDSNKPLDKVEVNVYRKRSRLILIVEIAAITILCIFGVKDISACIAISIFALSLMLLLGNIKNMSKKLS